MLLKPRVATEVNFVDEASGRRASDSTVVQLLTQEILERPSQAHPGILPGRKRPLNLTCFLHLTTSSGG